MTECSRPLLRYFGGKWRIAPWIISHFPPHEIYTEVFGGAASVLLRKPRSEQEVYNDLDGELVTLFRVLRSDRAEELISAVALTPFSREEFDLAYQEDTSDQVEIARRLIVRSFFGYGGGLSIVRRPTSFRAVNRRTGNAPVISWANYPSALRMIVERLRGVTVENKPAVDVLTTQDRPEALHYVDPPYVMETRSGKVCDGGAHHGYRHDMRSTEHIDLLDTLTSLKGRVILSGYPCDLYDNALTGWTRQTMDARDDSAKSRTEVIWMNFDPASAPPPGGLFETQEQ